MAKINLAKLFGKLNKTGYKCVEGATTFAKMRGNSNVEIVHWLAQILQLQDSDVVRIIRHYEIDSSKLASDMTNALDALPRGGSMTDLSGDIVTLMQESWLNASLLYYAQQVRTGHLFI